MAYSTKTACFNGLLTALSSGGLGMREVNAQLVGVTIGGWGDIDVILAAGNSIATFGSGGKAPDATKWPAFADSDALRAACAAAETKAEITDVMLRLCNTRS